TEEIAERLHIEMEKPIYDILRVRLVKGEPYVLEYTYMPVGVIPGINQQILEGAIYSYIQDDLNLKIARSYKQIRADKATLLDQQ
ncbi:UTRA domain-containing protein, partial [Listeria monocytogenes]|uniref:UTRA domain-containing protein n=1 Tax=Listeria monocytogenes TaxID=1639 RepID=UPI003FA46827